MTEHRIAKSSLKAATLEWIERFAPYGVLATDLDLCVQSWNQWMQLHSGLQASEVIGRKLTDIYPELIARRLVGHLDRALQGQVSVLSTALHGHLLPLPSPSRESGFSQMKQTASIAPLVANDIIYGTIVVIEDVTQREWQSDILRRQHARDEILSWALAHLLRADDPRRVSRELFCKVATHLDFDSYLLYLLDSEDAFFHLSAAGGLTPIAEKSVEKLPCPIFPWFQAVKEGQVYVRDYQQIQTDSTFAIGKSLGFHAYILLPLIAGSSLLGLLVFATRSRDSISKGESELLETISHYLAVALNREKSDRDLREAQRKLNEHALELERKVAERTASLNQSIAELQTFSSTVAHDLRAPIRALSGYCEVLLEDYGGQLPEAAGKVVAKLRDSAVRMDTLTRDLLEFTQVSQQSIQLSVVNLEEVMESALPASGSDQTPAVQINRPLHRVLAHRTLVDQCISNLVDNALKFVAPGAAHQVTIRSEIVPASIPGDPHDTRVFNNARFALSPDSSHSSTRVRLWVEDKGIGVPREARQKIFGVFERGVHGDQYEGTGMGLAIVARAMERMRGNCGVESEPGGGSRFWLDFLPPEILDGATTT